MKRIVFWVLTAVSCCFCFILPAHADDSEVVISPEQWKTATDAATPGRNWRHTGSEGSVGVPGEKGAPVRQKKSTLRPGGGSMVNANDSNFDSQVMRSSEPVLVEFWRPGCGHCVKMEGPVSNISNSVKVVRVNTDENEKTPARFGVSGVPAFFLVKDGNIAGSAVGSMPEEHLRQKLGLSE